MTKLLIVDDDKFLLDMYALKFSEQGFAVTACASGEEVLQKLDEGLTPEVFLVDLIMAGLDGFSLIQKLKERSLNAKIVILSNLGSQEDVERGLSLGVDGYIIKASATPSGVVDKVKEILAKKS